MYLECIGCFHCNRLILTVAIVDAFHWLESVKYFRRPVVVIDEDHAEHDFTSAEQARHVNLAFRLRL